MAEGARPALVVPAFGRIYESLSECVYPLMRFTMGAILVPHGMQKLFGMFSPPPMDAYVKVFGTLGTWAASPYWVYYIGCIEFFGGICIALGLLTRFWALQAAAFMAIAAFLVQGKVAYFWTSRGMELPLTWMIFFLIILIRGGGKCSIDRMIGKEF